VYKNCQAPLLRVAFGRAATRVWSAAATATAVAASTRRAASSSPAPQQAALQTRRVGGPAVAAALQMIFVVDEEDKLQGDWNQEWRWGKTIGNERQWCDYVHLLFRLKCFFRNRVEDGRRLCIRHQFFLFVAFSIRL